MFSQLNSSPFWLWIKAHPLQVLLGTIPLHVAAYFLFGPRIKLVDDYHYINTAYDLIERGAFSHPNTFAGRWVVFPLALSIKLFGANAYSVTLPALLVNISCMLLVYWAIPKKGLALGAVGFVATSYYVLFHSLHFMPDVFVNALVLLSLNALYRYSQQHKTYWLLLAAIALCLASLMKLSALYLAPLMALWLVLQKPPLRHLLHAMASIFGIGMLSLLFYQEYFGDAWFRLHIIEQDHNVSIFSYRNADGNALLKRLLLGPIPILAEFSAWGILVLTGLLVAFRKVRMIKTDFWLFFALGLLLLNWLGTTSFATYNPLPVVHRMWTGSFLLSIIFLSTHFHHIKKSDFFIATAVLVLYASFELGMIRWMALTIVLLVLGIMWWKKWPIELAFGPLLLIGFGNNFKYLGETPTTPYSQFESLRQVALNPPDLPVFARHPLHIKEVLFAKINGFESMELQKFEDPETTQGYLLHAKNTQHEGYLKKLDLFKKRSKVYYEDEHIIVFQSNP